MFSVSFVTLPTLGWASPCMNTRPVPANRSATSMVARMTSGRSGLPAKGSAEITNMSVSLWLKTRSRNRSTE
jgi:hypothetical protein